jgi:hypothetical protein
MTTSRKSWSDLTPSQQKAVVVVGTLELVLTAVALADLVRRPAAQVRGPKWAWALGTLVQPVGPIAYLTAGRRPAA